MTPAADADDSGARRHDGSPASTDDPAVPSEVLTSALRGYLDHL